MANALAEYFQKPGIKVVEGSLQRVVGKPVAYLKDDAAYRMHVIQPGWSALPLGIRLLMKRHVHAWDELYEALRRQVLDLQGTHVALRPDAPVRITRLVLEKFGRPTGPAREVAPVMPVTPPAPAPVPLASPVRPKPEPAPVAEAGAVVGIDLGTTYSVVAHVDSHGRPCSLHNSDGERLTPSVVLFGDDGAVVGKQALLRSAFEPDRTAICVKRDMGAKHYRHPIRGEMLPPEVISAFILRSLRGDAARQLGTVRGAVITVPAYFDETRRRATMDAGRLAGLDVLDIINEPTAAAIAYGYQTGYLDRGVRFRGDRPIRALVFDLGGGTFDVTIVEIGPGSFKALATDGDVTLGGRDWDERLVDVIAGRFLARFGDDPLGDPISAHELWVAAEAAKRTLTERPGAVVHLYHRGQRVALEVTRAEFEEATAPLLERTRLTTEVVVRQAGLTYADLDRVLLVGGSTRMPMVTRMLTKLTGKVPDRSISPDDAVAHGAALYARLVAKTVPGASAEDAGDAVVSEDDNTDFTVTDVNSHSLGILGTDPDSGVKFNKIVIPKNSPLPCTVTKPFQTYREGQRAVLLKVLEGDSPRPTLCTPVGVCTIRNLPPDLPAGWPVEVSYTYESNGRLHLTAQLRGYPQGVAMDFFRENALPDEELDVLADYVAEEMEAGDR
jgi:molecular chaperone DnaK